MAGVKVTYTVIGEPAYKALTGLDLRTRNLLPVMQDFAGYMVGSVQRNFDAQGRPAKWAPLKISSLTGWVAGRKSSQGKAGAAARAGRKILTDTSLLRGGIHFKAFARGVEGYTNVKYAAIQHYGGQTRAHDIYPRVKKALAWPGGAHPVKVVHHPGSKIPARPFLMFQAEDIYGYLFPRLAAFVEGR